MKKKLLILAFLVVAVGGFAAGYGFRSPSFQEKVLKLKAERVAAPEWTEWQYPNGREQGSSKGGGGTANELTAGPLYAVILTTADDFDTVLKWYAKKFENETIAVPTGSGSVGKMNTANKEDPVINAAVLLDSARPSEESNKARPVQSKIVCVRTPRYCLVINISRAEGEAFTHIVLTYFPN